MNKGVIDSEANILAAKRDIEALNLKGQVVQRQRKKARAYSRWTICRSGSGVSYRIRGGSADVEVINNLGHAYFRQGDFPTAEP